MRARRGSQRGFSWSTRGRIAVLGFAAGGLALVTSGVGLSDAATSPTVKRVVVATLKTAKFGTILVSGRTLYTLKPSHTACTAACHKYWPELLLPKGANKAVAGKGVNASKLGSIPRPGGRRQVTYAGKALYWFSLDTAPGQVKGNVTDTWGKWSDVANVKPAVQVSSTTTTSPSAPTTTTTKPPTPSTNSTTTTTVPSGGGVGF